MKPVCQKMARAHKTMERRMIRVELPSAHAGVNAALHRAFAVVQRQPLERDFDDLLKRLN